MLISNLGYGGLILAFLFSIYGIIAAIYGALKNDEQWIRSARNAMLLTFPLVSLSGLSLILLLVKSDFQVEYVYNVTSYCMPLYLKITALWGGQAGSLLFWSWLLAAFASAATLRKWDRDRQSRELYGMLPWVIVVVLVTLGFFLSLSIFVENPYNRFWVTPNGDMATSVFQPAGATPAVPEDGQGLNPLLRHPGMIIHPPMQYLGFVAFVVPFAFAMAALITGSTDDRWIRVTRRWTLAAWLFLSLGLLLGSRWAYDVLGWGGYWGWDPVEISALMPWLTGTTFLHSVMIQEHRGTFKRWNLVLIILTYCLVILGTFLTRSGVLSSVHAFSSSAIGPLFFAFIGITFLISLGLLLYRWTSLGGEKQMTSLLSRESLFLFNNLLFMGIWAICFWGVLYPIFSELLTGQKVTVNAPFYEGASGPLWGALLLLMGVAPLSAWGRSTLKTLGRSAWKPAAASLVLIIGIVIWQSTLGTFSWVAMIGLGFCALSLCLTLSEYIKGVEVRRRVAGETLPVAFWRVAARNRRRYGGYIIHIGVVFMALGVIGIELFQSETQGTISIGSSLNLRGYTITLKKLDVFDAVDGRNIARAVLEIKRGGQVIGELYPRRDYYPDAQQQVTIPGIRSTMLDDLYIVLADWKPITLDGATFKIYHNPLVPWLWVGGLIFILGTLVAVLPSRKEED